jgi:ribonuclease J
MLKQLEIPIIYSSGLAYALIKFKLSEHKIKSQNMKWTHPRETVQVGQSFAVTYIRNNHSIADSYSLIIDTPAGRIVHSGDFKFDHSPPENQFFDIGSLARAGAEGVDLLISDSTNAEKAGYTPSEKYVIPKLKEFIFQTQKRTIITTFASQVNRVKIIMQLALQAKKKVTVFGRSMINLANISKELGYISLPENFIVRQEEIHKIPPEDLVILCTGSQGEQYAALSRIARNEHKYVKIQPGDLVVVSASPIPGNEKHVNNLINNLFARGAEVVYGSHQKVHVSGHASQEEQKILISLCDPKYFMPCHGEYRMLVKHGETAVKCGVDPDNIFLMDNGDVLTLQNGKCKLEDRVTAGIVMIDNDNVGELDGAIIKERKLIANDGFLLFILTIDAYGRLITDIKVRFEAMVLPKKESAKSYAKKLKQVCLKAFESLPDSNSDKALENINAFSRQLEGAIRHDIMQMLNEEMHRYPLTEVIILNSFGSAKPQVQGVLS